MRFLLRVAVCFAIVAICALPVSAQEKRSGDVLTLLDVFELEFASDPQISPG